MLTRRHFIGASGALAATRLVRRSAGFALAAYLADTIPRELCLSLLKEAVPPFAVNRAEIVR